MEFESGSGIITCGNISQSMRNSPTLIKPNYGKDPIISIKEDSETNQNIFDLVENNN